MAAKVGPEDFDLLIQFGGGLRTRPAEGDIQEREAADGNNFLLDLENRELKRRPAFDLVATAPNAGSILGGGSYLKSDGTVKAFIQAGNTVYDFDGSSFDASPVLDTVNAASQLRGHWRSHAWTLADKVIVTDLSLNEVVKEWDGTTWADIAFLSDPSTSFGTFFAKYCQVSNERAWFAHIKDAGATTRHLIVGAKRGDYTTIDVTNRPSTSLSAEDPFFLLAPDLRPINGLVSAFGTLLVSTEQGEIFHLTGSNGQDFAFHDFYPGSGAAGAESLAYVGNDIIYGRKGRVESLTDTDKFGDTEADDITRQIANTVKAYTGWQTIYNSRLNRVYLFPTGQSEVWVFESAMRGGEVSEWMRWTTSHALAFQPTFAMSMLDPSDTLEYVFMGDSSGNLYRLEGTGTSGDGGTSEIAVDFLSKLFTIPLNAQAYNVEGYIKYRKDVEATVELVFEYAGESIFNETITINLPAVTGRRYYGSNLYYDNEAYYGAIIGRLARQPLSVPGQGNEFQVRAKITGSTDFSISEIGLRFTVASSIN